MKTATRRRSQMTDRSTLPRGHVVLLELIDVMIEDSVAIIEDRRGDDIHTDAFIHGLSDHEIAQAMATLDTALPEKPLSLWNRDFADCLMFGFADMLMKELDRRNGKLHSTQ